MSRRDLFERILASLNAAALDDTLWPAASGLIDAFYGSTNNSLVFAEGASPDDIDLLFVQFCFRGQRDTELEREYFEAYYPVDERLPRLPLLPHGKLTPVADLYTEQEKKASAVYGEFLHRTRSADGFNIRLDGPHGSNLLCVVGDSVEGDGWSSEQVESIQRLLPHIRQFVGFRQALADAGVLRASLTGLLDNVHTGVVQLDRRGRVTAANDCARDLLRRGDGLSDRGGLLQAALPVENARLQALLAQALPFFGGPGAGGSMMVSRTDGLRRLILHVRPVNEDGPDPRQSRVGALVLIVDPANHDGVDADLVGAMLGLTPAQSEVAMMLAQGRTIREIAVETRRCAPHSRRRFWLSTRARSPRPCRPATCSASRASSASRVSCLWATRSSSTRWTPASPCWVLARWGCSDPSCSSSANGVSIWASASPASRNARGAAWLSRVGWGAQKSVG